MIGMNQEKIPALLFGQNLEHTRGCIFHGLGAQLVRNRKFAGKPSPDGVAADWEPFGASAFYELLTESYTRHFSANAMPRRNELGSQSIQQLAADGDAGIRQSGLSLMAGKVYIFRAALRSLNGDFCPVTVRLADGEKRLAEQRTTIASPDWEIREFRFGPFDDLDATLSLGVTGRHTLAVGMVSLLPEDHFHGMRHDVIAQLKALGTAMLRWPGGNFAGEYRWRDGLLDSDCRAPLQSFTEIETQPYTHGYDDNEPGVDEVIALCREIGAEPFFTINPAWDTPEESAAWVEYCNGAPDSPGGKLRAERGFPEPYRVRFWSLGNEMGYGHMEGPQTPAAYAELSRRHAQAMLRVTPDLTLFSSGPYPSEAWARDVAMPLADVAPMVSLHHYTRPGHQDFTTPERTEKTLQTVIGQADEIVTQARAMRRMLPDRLSISFDEWNVWYAWYRQVGVAEGLFAARVLHQLLAVYRELGIGCACYFQPVNEGAIAVSARTSRLTAVGQVMRLMSRHAGGIADAWDHRPEEVFASRHDDGTRWITLFNPSPREEREFALPWTGTVLEAEWHTPSGVLPGSTFTVTPVPLEKRFHDGRVRLPPLTVLGMRLR